MEAIKHKTVQYTVFCTEYPYFHTRLDYQTRQLSKINDIYQLLFAPFLTGTLIQGMLATDQFKYSIHDLQIRRLLDQYNKTSFCLTLKSVRRLRTVPIIRASEENRSHGMCKIT